MWLKLSCRIRNDQKWEWKRFYRKLLDTPALKMDPGLKHLIMSVWSVSSSTLMSFRILIIHFLSDVTGDNALKCASFTGERVTFRDHWSILFALQAGYTLIQLIVVLTPCGWLVYLLLSLHKHLMFYLKCQYRWLLHSKAHHKTVCFIVVWSQMCWRVVKHNLEYCRIKRFSHSLFMNNTWRRLRPPNIKDR